MVTVHGYLYLDDKESLNAQRYGKVNNTFYLSKNRSPWKIIRPNIDVNSQFHTSALWTLFSILSYEPAWLFIAQFLQNMSTPIKHFAVLACITCGVSQRN